MSICKASSTASLPASEALPSKESERGLPEHDERQPSAASVVTRTRPTSTMSVWIRLFGSKSDSTRDIRCISMLTGKPALAFTL